MKLGNALRLILSRWNVTAYRLAKESGVGQSTIGKLVNGDMESSSWDIVERLADGFGKIDPIAKPAFLGALSVPDSAYPKSFNQAGSMPAEPYDSINAEAVEILHEREFLNSDAIEKSGLKINGDRFFDSTLGDWITMRMYERRLKQNQTGSDSNARSDRST